MSEARGVSQVVAYRRPLVAFHDTYQDYYVEALREALASHEGRLELRTLGRFPRTFATVRRLDDRGLLGKLGGARGADAVLRLARRLEGPVRTPSGRFHDTVGQYLASVGDRSVKACIDSADTPDLSSPELVDWADVYFKTNRWVDREYPRHVRPLVNGDPLVLPRLETFRALRGRSKSLDLSFVVRVWGGRDMEEGVEHNLRLLEALGKVPGETLVLAVMQAGDIERIESRLARLGIRSTRRAVGAEELWEITASTRLTVMRLGLHWCIPWRATGLLASGAAPIFDRTPFSAWPEPLVAGTHFLDLGLDVGPESPVAPAEAYDAVPDRVREWLATPGLAEVISARNAAYFERSLASLPVGTYLLEQLARG